MLELVFIRLETDDKRGADVNVLTSSVTPEGCTGEQPLPGAYGGLRCRGWGRAARGGHGTEVSLCGTWDCAAQQHL